MTPTDQELLDAAKAVVQRWDEPLWKYMERDEKPVHTKFFIQRLRNAIEKVEGDSK
jgi:chemotaxis regulatin CheY-phosphate phosphatase CheZ